MKNYNTYVNDARRLSSEASKESEDSAGINKKLLDMREKIRRSQLTVYQKEFLLNQLCSLREMEHAKSCTVSRKLLRKVAAPICNE